ncbi:MAG: FolC bifunctional protein [Sphingobacteriaceae bacterium]|jgi:dihydrofolate synthase/folylpolyglutamate synthase|nr:FolC bifunctional protein [Sphingobacteriaceae bacterium]
MDYNQTLDYLYSRLPMFNRVGASAYKKDLHNTIELCKRLGNPENRFKSIHVAGTNGKGSTSHMLAAILQTAGYKTGLYTSPHLLDFRERIRINGEMIPENYVVDFVGAQQESIEEIEPSFFEATVAMAFQYFADEQVDIAVIEVGLGGRLDSTNVITPLLSVITNIGYDHMNLLGNTLGEIASEKAGIIKPGISAVIGEKQEASAGVFLNKAKEAGSELVFASEMYTVEGVTRDEEQRFLQVSLNDQLFELDLTGSYQAKNVCTVLASVEQLRKQGYRLPNDIVKSALKKVKSLTGLMGRWQTINESPLIICDTGHNEDGIREVLKNIESTPHKKLHVVLGMVNDKDSGKILSLLPRSATYYFCQPDLERAKPVQQLRDEAATCGLEGRVFDSVKSALNAAKANAPTDDLIFVGGSTFVVAEVL